MTLNLTNFNTNINNCRIFNYLSTNNIFTPEANISNLNAINLNVSGDAIITGNLSVVSIIYVSQTEVELEIVSDLTITSSLFVGGNSTFGGDLTIVSNLLVLGDTITTNEIILGDLTIASNLRVLGNTTTNNQSVLGNLTVASNLIITGDTTTNIKVF
jgi:hypothetical protein